MISKTLIAASTKSFVLSILVRGENYGYQIIQSVKQISSGKLEWSDGMLYPVLHRLEKENPQKIFHTASPVSECPNMKLTTLEKIAWCLEDLTGEVTVPEEVAERARRPIERMLEVTGA